MIYKKKTAWSDYLSDEKNWVNLIGWSKKPDQHGLTKLMAVSRTA